MAMVTGPRQVGKTTTSRASAGPHRYLTWDRQTDRLLITRGADAVAEALQLGGASARRRTVVFDEIHKYAKWKSFLKGFFDVYADASRVVVTGSARLGFFRRGGDSLMGRYFLYRMHPLSVGELASTRMAEREIKGPAKVAESSFEQLLRFGGFPEPFLKDSTRFFNRWRRLRTELLFREDLRDLTQIHEAGQVEVLAELLAHQTGQPVNYSHLAAQVNIAVDTVRRWISALESLFYCYRVRPWFRNVPKSLRKQPKIYLWDWSQVEDRGARWENMVASHLLKAVHWWTDMGLGTYELYYLRDKNKREVDFVVTRNMKPWFLVEVKTSGKRGINPNLNYYQLQTRARHAFQVVFDLGFAEEDCFAATQPVRVPAITFLSQLV
ncbi:MAG: ATP-binding protein [Kiritimatiellae bacterium]|nr:ATP-binding protein [Kiritimatiellia bacterium]